MDARLSTKAIVQQYFREVRPELVHLKIDEDLVSTVDSSMQSLMRLASAPNRKQSYLRTLGRIRTALPEVATQREFQISSQRAPSRAIVPNRSETEVAIAATLRRLGLETAARSYEQALSDLSTDDRVSYRGTANELRQVLWEVLERLAPDKAVMQPPEFRLEMGRTSPTQRQRVHFILRARGASAKATKTAEEAVSLVEQTFASLTRSVYDRSSASAHVSFSRQEVLRLRNYATAVLSDLLEIHQ
jgi:hypothetical protein